eukprot:TRINITY_DN3377_c0_g2_i4.p1 TRINITY_DN3377_c0_g2~~TRINITY_DN3377_c0_g2_i4.p1  ORF type:complete len:184 (-),score=30.61 TRINITY_DN3377_c0_g2_i4:141-692(-)
MVFAIIPKKRERSFRKEHKDIESFATTATTTEGLHPSLVILTDNKELVSSILSIETIRTITKYISNFDYLWFTDQNPFSKFKKTLRFVFKLPQPQEMDSKIKVPIQMVFFLIDRMASVRLSMKAKEKAQKLRYLASKSEKQQQNNTSQEKKVEERVLTPEEQKKKERKEAKKRNPYKYKVFKS